MALALALTAAAARADDGAQSAPSWDACEASSGSARYFLGRFAHGVGVVEVGRSNASAVAKLWAHAKLGGAEVNWPGRRLGVRHLENPKSFSDATAVAAAGRLYVWEALNGWGGSLAPITGIEIAKSLCDANTLVIYAVLKFDQPGEGFMVASVNPPEGGDPTPVSVEPSKELMNKLYAGALDRLHSGLRAQRLAPSQVEISVLPGHFSGDALEYVVSLKWQNGFDDRFSLVGLADQSGEIKTIVDRQEGGAGALVREVADLEGGRTQDVIYELQTLDGSTAALWSLRDGKLKPLVQTTPVGE